MVFNYDQKGKALAVAMTVLINCNEYSNSKHYNSYI